MTRIRVEFEVEAPKPERHQPDPMDSLYRTITTRIPFPFHTLHLERMKDQGEDPPPR